MKTVITSGLAKERKEEVIGEFKHSPVLRERLIEILVAKNESNKSSVRSKASYASPSWGYEQADAIGYERAIYEIISLLSSSDGEKELKTK